MRRREFMKKFIAIPLVAVMLAALAVPALAEENTGKLTTTTEPTQIDVFGKRDTDTTGAGTVYSVDIKWGNMHAIYQAERTRTWDPETLEVTELTDSDSKWTWDRSTSSDELAANQIAITNHSNTGITCTVQFIPEENLSGKITGVVTNEAGNQEESIWIKSATEAVGADLAEKLSSVTKSGYLKLSGTLNSDQSDFQKIGTILVTLQDPAT